MSGSDIDRRIAERDEADRRYNEALTALDRALPALGPDQPAAGPPGADVPDLAAPPPLEAAPPGGGWRGRLAGFVWRTVAPVFARQQAYNERAAAHAAQTARALREATAALREAQARQRQELQDLIDFESKLIQFLQQITPFIDTKTRVLEASVEQLRMVATSAQRAAVAARREIQRPAGAPPPPGAEGGAHDQRPARPPGRGAAADYVGFEDLFRGSTEEIRARQAAYADRFRGAADVLDVGCGRGELLDLLRERGVSARGIDVNPEMVEICRARGLDAHQADALGYLDAQPDGSLGGLIAAQVVEHLEPSYLVRTLEAAYDKLRPGSLLVLETINVACWLAFFESYLRDITHVRPLHPDTLKFLVVAAGFEDVEVHFRAPIDPAGRLQHADEHEVPAALLPAIRTLNANVDRLNDRLFTYLDYAVTGTRGGS